MLLVSTCILLHAFRKALVVSASNRDVLFSLIDDLVGW